MLRREPYYSFGNRIEDFLWLADERLPVTVFTSRSGRAEHAVPLTNWREMTWRPR